MPVSTSAPSRQRWLLPVLVAVIALTVGGGLLAREVYREPGQVQQDPGIVPPPATSIPPQEQPGSRLVTVNHDASAHPEDEEIRALLQLFFDSINDRNYERWKTTVTADRVRSKSQSDWLDEYRTTRDGNIVIYRIEASTEQRLQVMVGFTSTQSIEDAPKTLPETCVQWLLTLPVTRESGQWKLDTVPSGSIPEHSSCT